MDRGQDRAHLLVYHFERINGLARGTVTEMIKPPVDIGGIVVVFASKGECFPERKGPAKRMQELVQSMASWKRDLGSSVC